MIKEKSKTSSENLEEEPFRTLGLELKKKKSII